MSFSEKCVNKPVTTLLVFITLIVLGIYCVFQLPIDMYPEMELPYMVIYTSYPNAGPEEVEQNLTRVLESSLSGVSGLKKMQSKSSTGASTITLEFNYGTNLENAANEIRDKIDLVRSSLPEDSKSPISVRMDPTMRSVIDLVLKGNRTPEELRQYAEEIVQPRLEQLEGIASADISGGREKSINVEIPRDRLDAYGLSITQVAQMIGVQNIQVSGGIITVDDTDFTIKTSGKYKSVEDLKNTVITYKPSFYNGIAQMNTILLRDIADVYEGYKDVASLASLDNEPCVMFEVQKQSGKNSVQAVDNVRKAIPSIEAALPSDVKIIEFGNDTDMIRETIKEVIESVLIGASLAIIILFVFLRSFKSTLIISLSIPISVMVTLFLMYIKNITINTISLGGILLGIGMFVDNSIVVLENIYSYRQRGAKPRIAAILGTKEMVVSISASTFTSACIFLPVIMFKNKIGFLGQMFSDIAWTMVFSLLCSLVVAIALVPVLASSFLKIDKIENTQGTGIAARFSRKIEKFFIGMEEKYAASIRFILRHKLACFATVLALFAVSIFSVKYLGFFFIPESEPKKIRMSIKMPQGTPLEVTEEVAISLQQMALHDVVGVKHSTITVGGEGVQGLSTGSNSARVVLQMYKIVERKPGYDNVKSAKAKLRKYFNMFPGAEISFGSGGTGISVSNDISIDIRSDDLALVRSTAAQVEKLLREKAECYITEISSDLEDGLPQAEIIINRPRMYELGVTVASVAAEISASVSGATSTRFSSVGSDTDVIVRLSPNDASKISDIDKISVVNAQGLRVPLSAFAHCEFSYAPVTIFRENQSRVIHVTGKPVEGVSLGEIQTGLKNLINTNIPNEEKVTIDISGAFEDMIQNVLNFALIIFMAIILVFVVMASQFESFRDPFIILFTIPLSFIGVVAIYALKGDMLNIFTIIGMLILVGTIVNNGIVLVDYTNLLRSRGMSLDEACVEAGKNRLRPILMSTLTTIISIIPMAFFPSQDGSPTFPPIALTVFGGLSFGSLMTLFLMPTIYHIFKRPKKDKKFLKIQKSVDDC